MEASKFRGRPRVNLPWMLVRYSGTELRLKAADMRILGERAQDRKRIG